MRKTDAFRRAAALLAALSITVSLAAPAFAGTYYIDYGDIIITKMDDGSQKIEQNGEQVGMDAAGDETIITTYKKAITTLESDLEGPAAEDSGFGPVVEDNYQPAPPAQPEDAEEPEGADRKEAADQPEDAEEPKAADRKESTEEPKSADRQESDGQQPQQAAPADAAPAAPTSVNPKDNGFWGNTITVINNFADKVLNLTLKDVKIDVSDTGTDNYFNPKAGKAALSVQGSGDVEIELDGKNELKSGFYKAGLEKNTSAGKLTLKDDNKEAGSGSLKANGGARSAGIGGSKDNGTNNITINGGTVTAAGGSYGAGIGGGQSGSGKNITINGGTVNATGGLEGAGIGGGDSGSGENITINSGTVTAAGGSYGAGIGGGYLGDHNSGNGGKDITINGGTVTATGGDCGAGIGGGSGSIGSGGGGYGSGKDITINGGTVIAAGGKEAAGIGGGCEGNGEDITITGGTVTAKGGEFGAGIGGGRDGSGETITINDGTVTAAGTDGGAGIGGGESGSGSNVTVSGAAQVTTTAGKSNGYAGAGATIGSGGNYVDDDDNESVNGKEIQADISRVTTGYIHHIIYDPALVSEDNPLGIVREWWEPERPQPNPENPQPNPEDPNAPAEESNEVSLGTPGLHVETLEGDLLPFDAQQQGSTLRVTSDNLAARLHGTRQALETLQEQGVEQIEFVTSFKTTTLSVEDLLAEGGSRFALEHNGPVSRLLSAAQAESLKCRMR